tara:strand:- start:118 stop:468 length:351 start_codon:yes stop_codon:yes gene_type:complete
MEFDREGEFDRVMEEIFPVSIPSAFVKSISVKLSNGQQVVLKGDELLNPLPVANDFSWDKLVEQFDAIEDIQVFIDMPAIRQNVVMNVKKILNNHFKEYLENKAKYKKKQEKDDGD